MENSKPVGLTAKTGFQVGVRRTFPISVEQAWKLITSQDGLKIWLGETSLSNMDVGQQFHTKNNVSGEIRVVNLHKNIRLGWKKENWTNSSTVQVRTILSNPDKTIISFHQENLQDIHTRAEMQQYWEDVLDRLRTVIK